MSEAGVPATQLKVWRSGCARFSGWQSLGTSAAEEVKTVPDRAPLQGTTLFVLGTRSQSGQGRKYKFQPHKDSSSCPGSGPRNG